MSAVFLYKDFFAKCFDIPVIYAVFSPYVSRNSEKALYYSKRAAKNYKSIITNPEAPFIHILKAMYELKYPTEDCLKFLDDTIKKFPEIPFFYDQQGILFERLKKLKEANESYCRRDIAKIQIEIEKVGAKPVLIAQLASCYSDMNDSKNALKYAKAAIKNNYRTDRVYRDMIKAMYLLEKPVEEILKIVNEAIKFLPKCPEFYAERGMIFASNNRIDEGIRDLQKSIDVWNEITDETHDNCYFTRIADRIYLKLLQLKGESNAKN